jgi:hypothetical protein
MLDTPYTRKIRSQILNNNQRYIKNLDMVNGEHSGFLNGGNLDTQICEGCGTTLRGGKNKFNSFMHGLRDIGNYLKPVTKPILHAATNKIVEGINSGGVEAMAGAGVKAKRGKYITHKGDKDYHIDRHDVQKAIEPYTQYKRKTKGAGIKEELIKDAKALGKPILKTIANHYLDKGIKYLGGEMDPLKRRAMKNGQIVHQLEGGKIKKVSNWIEHVKKFSKNNNISYKDAMKHPECKSTYIK